jgi:ParB-like chromosome segregation protein Spo0J
MSAAVQIPKPNGRVHEVAAMFPLLPDDELDELAADMKANGQLHPIILDRDGMLIDGRNRQEACKRAGIKPAYEVLNGQDPIAFILSANINRRHLTKGQQAMAVAKARLLSKQTMRAAAQVSNVSPARVSQASLVLEYANDLSEAVLSGNTSLNDAYKIAQERKEASDSNESWMVKLRLKAPDLADQIAEERLTLAESKAVFHAREKEESEKEVAKRQERRLTTEQLAKALDYLDPWSASTDQRAFKFLNLFDPQAVTSKITAARIEQCSAVLTRLAEIWPQK